MTTIQTDKYSLYSAPPKWFTVLAVLALIWNIVGVIAFVDQMKMTAEMLDKLTLKEQQFYTNISQWVNIAFACAVFGGLCASLALLLRKKISIPLFLFSLFGVIIQMYHAFFINNSFEVFGPSSIVMPTMVIVLAILFLWLALSAKAKHWLS